jgi:hypothetical protein
MAIGGSMPQIELSADTFRRLQRLAEPFVDTPETIILRLLTQHEVNGGTVTKPPRVVPTQGRRTRRARRGERTPADVFYLPIVEVLRDAGGALPTQETVDRVEKLVRDQLSEADFEPLQSSGELRWRNTCRWARKYLVQAGVLDKMSEHGVWRLAHDYADRLAELSS